MKTKALLDFRKAFEKERKEHPKLPRWVVKQIVRDHKGKK